MTNVNTDFWNWGSIAIHVITKLEKIRSLRNKKNTYMIASYACFQTNVYLIIPMWRQFLEIKGNICLDLLLQLYFVLENICYKDKPVLH